MSLIRGQNVRTMQFKYQNKASASGSQSKRLFCGLLTRKDPWDLLKGSGARGP